MGKWIGIVGESFANDDGSSRQEEIARCSIGEEVKLRHDPNNPYDPNCVQVISRRGIQIGNLSKEHAAVFASHMRAGHSIDAEIVKINGGSAKKPSLGIVIEADVDEDDFDRALEFARGRGLAGQRFHDEPGDTGVSVPIITLSVLAVLILLTLAMCS